MADRRVDLLWSRSVCQTDMTRLMSAAARLSIPDAGETDYFRGTTSADTHTAVTLAQH